MRPGAKLARALGAGPLSGAARLLAVTARHTDWLEANETRAHLELVMKAVFETYPVLIAPATPVAAFPHDRRPESRRSLRISDGGKIAYKPMGGWLALASACGLPATVVPAGLTAGGLPIGVQVIGPRGADSRTLAVAQSIEEALGGFVSPPED